MPQLRARLDADGLVLLASLIAAGVMAALCVAPPQWVAVLLLLLLGVGWIIALTTLNGVAQSILPNWVRGRGLAVYLMVFNGAMAAGSLGWGLVAQAVGVPMTLLVGRARPRGGGAGLPPRQAAHRRGRPPAFQSLARAAGRRTGGQRPRTGDGADRVPGAQGRRAAFPQAMRACRSSAAATAPTPGASPRTRPTPSGWSSGSWSSHGPSICGSTSACRRPTPTCRARPCASTSGRSGRWCITFWPSSARWGGRGGRSGRRLRPPSESEVLQGDAAVRSPAALKPWCRTTAAHPCHTSAPAGRPPRAPAACRGPSAGSPGRWRSQRMRRAAWARRSRTSSLASASTACQCAPAACGEAACDQQRGGVQVAEPVARLAFGQRQGLARVVLEVDVADGAVRALHQVAVEGLAQVGAVRVHQGDGVQALAPDASRAAGPTAAAWSSRSCSTTGGRPLSPRSEIRRPSACCASTAGTRRPTAPSARRRRASMAIGGLAARVGHRRQHVQPEQARRSRPSGGSAPCRGAGRPS